VRREEKGGNLELKKKRGSCRAGLGGWEGGCCMEHKAMKRVLYMRANFRAFE